MGGAWCSDGVGCPLNIAGLRAFAGERSPCFGGGRSINLPRLRLFPVPSGRAAPPLRSSWAPRFRCPFVGKAREVGGGRLLCGFTRVASGVSAV